MRSSARAAGWSKPLRVWTLGILWLGALAGGAALLTTRHGIGLRSDSAVYVAAARNLLGGDGLSWLSGGGEVRPMTFYGPLLSLVLAGAEGIGLDGIAFARWLNALWLTLDVVLVGELARRMTRSIGFGLVAALIVAGTGELLRVHVWLMSEPLFAPLVLGSVLALTAFFEGRNRAWLVLSALGVGLAALTRYAGLGLPLAGAAMLWIDPQSTWRRRLSEASLMLALGLGPSALWMARGVLLTGQTGGRSFGFSLGLWPEIRNQAFAIAMNWFAPLRLVEIIMARPHLVALLVSLAGLAVAVLIAMLLRRSVRLAAVTDPRLSGTVLLLFSLAAFLSVVFAAALFSRPTPDVDERVLSLAYLMLCPLLAALLAWLWGRGLALRVMIVVVLVLFLRNKLVYDYWTIRELSADGLGYASRAWRSSPTIEEVVAMDPGVIYTNETAAIYLLANRPSYWVPWALPGYDPGSADRIEAEMLEVLLEHNGVVVLFGDGDLPPGWSGAGLRTAVQTDDGVILSPDSGEPG
ncbi:MAG: phospholipid carrier-dependent glycosyltransferase [Chloroflexi bacterium]|nr:phospholipid carrier-dependent glycosyltransferase [Chloroflexota bacterium]